MTRTHRRPGGLPAETTRLIGREAELTQLTRLCREYRLVTVVGTGGVGKTRLALRAAAGLRSRFADGVCWVELSSLRDGDSLPYAIAEALPLTDQTTRPMADAVTGYLAGRELLLVLDTCEHLADACALLAAALLAAAPGVRILATSRCPLGQGSERVYRIEPLTGDRKGAAVTLLAERAAEAIPGFRVTDGNAADVVRLCQRLEGLPLAIELAAARLTTLSARELANRLDDRFAALEDNDDGDAAVNPPWHRALRTAIGWSHELCQPPERLLWARLSVFAGVFDAEMARDVCGDPRLPGCMIPPLLGVLADRSILTRVSASSGTRFRMLDTIREYGAFWLRHLGEEHELRRRHRDRYLALARQADATWLGPGQFAWCDRMTGELDNVRTALEFALDHPEGDTTLELAGSLWFLWYCCGYAREGQRYLDRALAADAVPSRARNKALWASCLVLVCLGDATGARVRASECAISAEKTGDTEAMEHALGADAVAEAMMGDLTGSAGRMQRLIPEQDEFALPALLFQAVRGHALGLSGQREEAVAVLNRLRADCDRHGEHWMRAWSDCLRAEAELLDGRFDAAEAYGRTALAVKHRMHDSLGAATAIDMLARTAAATARGERAARLLGLGQQLWDTLGRPQIGIQDWIAAREAAEKQARRAIGDGGYEAGFEKGRTCGLDSGIAYATGRSNVTS